MTNQLDLEIKSFYESIIKEYEFHNNYDKGIFAKPVKKIQYHYTLTNLFRPLAFQCQASVINNTYNITFLQTIIDLYSGHCGHAKNNTANNMCATALASFSTRAKHILDSRKNVPVPSYTEPNYKETADYSTNS